MIKIVVRTIHTSVKLANGIIATAITCSQNRELKCNRIYKLCTYIHTYIPLRFLITSIIKHDSMYLIVGIGLKMASKIYVHPKPILEIKNQLKCINTAIITLCVPLSNVTKVKYFIRYIKNCQYFVC